MYKGWPCPRPVGGMGEEMALAFDQNRSLRLLVIPPLFEEANKFRHQLFEIMRRMDLRGVDCFLPDLPGCNESTAPVRYQTLAGWRAATEAASNHFRATHILAIRSGAWLAPQILPGWLYAPAKPKQVLRSLIRARTLASKEAGREETGETLLDMARSEGIELAGWELDARLVRELEQAEFAPGPDHVIIEQADIGGKPLWLRAENDDDPEQADALAAIIALGLSEA